MSVAKGRTRTSRSSTEKLSAEDRARLWRAIHERSNTRAELALQWVQELRRVATDLASRGLAASIDTISVFWIRLHGVLVELGEFYEYNCTLAKDCGAEGTPLARQNAAVRDAIVAARDAFDEDERIWIHYRRDTECHVWPESYELGVKTNGKLREERKFALLGDTSVHVDEFSKRARALLRKHGVNEPAMGVYFARVVAPHVARILVAMRPLY